MKKDRNNNKGHFPKIVVDKTFLDEVEDFGRHAVKPRFVADYYRVCKTTWDTLCKKHPEIMEAYRRGHTRTCKMVLSKLIELVQKGNPTAIIFWTKCNADMSELIRAPEKDPDKPAPPVMSVRGKDPVEAARIYQQIMIKD